MGRRHGDHAAACLLYTSLEELERAIEQLRREEPEKKRLCWGLGILGGLFLAVVLM